MGFGLGQFNGATFLRNELGSFADVTELPNELVSVEQLEKIYTRYHWAGNYCHGKRVLELACGGGQGLGYLSKIAQSLWAGDFSEHMLRAVREHHKDQILICCLDAQSLPFSDDSFDVVILLEAIYYLPDAKKFVDECRRTLRTGGKVLVATANKDLYDFNPSPYSVNYYGVKELAELFRNRKFQTEFFGNTRIDGVSMRQRILRPIKKLAVAMHLIPKTMKGKRMLKRLVFGKLQPMPSDLDSKVTPAGNIDAIPGDRPDTLHKTIFCVATLV